MRAAKPLTNMMSLEEYMHLAEVCDKRSGEDSCPFEPKASDWDGSKAGWSRSTTRPRRGRPTNLLPLEALTHRERSTGDHDVSRPPTLCLNRASARRSTSFLN
jgi:hypothetical protein